LAAQARPGKVESVTLTERQQQFVDRYAIIPDPQERLAAVIAHRPKLKPLREHERTEHFLVRGCVSQVWLAGSREADGCHFRTDADSPLVKGLAGLLCELHEGAAAEEIATFEPALFEHLGIAQNLSPTRLNGLAQVQATIRKIALGS